MTAAILFFANLRETAGTKSLTLELPVGATLANVKALLVDRIPALKPMMGFVLMSVNREYATDEQTVPPDAEIAFFPPVSGG